MRYLLGRGLRLDCDRELTRQVIGVFTFVAAVLVVAISTIAISTVSGKDVSITTRTSPQGMRLGPTTFVDLDNQQWNITYLPDLPDFCGYVSVRNHLMIIVESCPQRGDTSRVENRRSGFSLPVAIGVLSHGPPQSGLA